MYLPALLNSRFAGLPYNSDDQFSCHNTRSRSEAHFVDSSSGADPARIMCKECAKTAPLQLFSGTLLPSLRLRPWLRCSNRPCGILIVPDLI